MKKLTVLSGGMGGARFLQGLLHGITSGTVPGVEADAEAKSGHLWWTRWTRLHDVPWIFTVVDGEYCDTLIPEESIDELLASGALEAAAGVIRATGGKVRRDLPDFIVTPAYARRRPAIAHEAQSLAACSWIDYSGFQSFGASLKPEN